MSTTSTEGSVSTIVMTADAYSGVVRCPSPIPLDEPQYYTPPTEKNSRFSRLGPPVTPPRKSSLRPPIQRRTSSNLVTRWNRVDVPDSVLIAELEELRRNVELANDNSPSDDHGLISNYRCNSCPCGTPSQDDDRKWKKTQKSAFGRRELIKTELTYLEGILQLDNKNVSKLVNYFQAEMLILFSVSIVTARSPLGLPSGFDCHLLSVAGLFPLRSNGVWDQFSLC